MRYNYNADQAQNIDRARRRAQEIREKRWIEYIGTMIPQYHTKALCEIKNIDNNNKHKPKGQR